jgi:hypothetical protein
VHTYINMGMHPDAKGRSREVWDGLPGMEWSIGFARAGWAERQQAMP